MIRKSFRLKMGPLDQQHRGCQQTMSLLLQQWMGQEPQHLSFAQQDLASFWPRLALGIPPAAPLAAASNL